MAVSDGSWLAMAVGGWWLVSDGGWRLVRDGSWLAVGGWLAITTAGCRFCQRCHYGEARGMYLGLHKLTQDYDSPERLRRPVPRRYACTCQRVFNPTRTTYNFVAQQDSISSYLD